MTTGSKSKRALRDTAQVCRPVSVPLSEVEFTTLGWQTTKKIGTKGIYNILQKGASWNVRKFISDIYRVALPKTGLILKKNKQELVPIIQGTLMPAKLQYLLAPKHNLQEAYQLH